MEAVTLAEGLVRSSSGCCVRRRPIAQTSNNEATVRFVGGVF